MLVAVVASNGASYIDGLSIGDYGRGSCAQSVSLLFDVLLPFSFSLLAAGTAARRRCGDGRRDLGRLGCGSCDPAPYFSYESTGALLGMVDQSIHRSCPGCEL
ncbi:MAG: hypothetical protein U0269_23370 [Polyangiales bacterium]